MVGAFLCAVVLAAAPQEPKSQQQKQIVEPPAQHGARPGQPAAGLERLEFDEGYWPKVPELPRRQGIAPASARPLSGRVARSGDFEASRETAVPAPIGEGAGKTRSGSNDPSVDLDSPLQEVFQFTRPPGAFRRLRGLTVWWRIVVYGDGGEILGTREVVHTLDCAFLERDRIAYEGKGTVYSRDGTARYAEREGMPWRNDEEIGGHELALFGIQMRMPWCFGDGITYAVLSSGTVDRPGERLRRVELERRPLQGSGLIGPVENLGRRDRFELIYDPGTGQPRELWHHFAAEGSSIRRVLLDDWREYEGLRLPYRRTYVDDAMRRRTVLEIVDIQPVRVTPRTFRLY